MAIAKASFGKGFSTVINYVMIQKGVDLALQPVLLECNNLRQGEPNFMARQMLEISKDHATTRPVMHVPISFNADEEINDEQAEKAINSILSDIGVDREKHQFIIVEHFDKPNTRHFHCVVNRVDLDAKLLPDSKIVYKLQVACDKAEVLQELKRTPNRTVKYDPSNELGYSYVTKKEKRKIFENRIKEGKIPHFGDDNRPQEKLALAEIEFKISQVLQTQSMLAKTPEEFKEKLAENGIEVRFSYDGKNDNAIRGASFKSDKIKVKGGQIGVKWDYINAHLEHNKAQYYNYEIEQPVKMNKVQAMHGTKTTDVAHTSQSARQYLKEEQKAKELSSTLIAGTAQSAQVQTARENLAEKELGETIAQIGKEVLQTAKTLEEFKYKLAKKGITVDFMLQAKGISGVKFTQNGISFKGSEIGLKIKEIEQKIQTNLDQAIAPSGATPTPTPTVEPFRKKEEPLVRKERNNVLFEWTLSEKEKADKAHIPKANAELKKAIESYPRKYIDLVRHLKETNTIQERGNELVISTENNEVSTLNKEYLKGLQPELNEKYWKWEKEMKAYKELISTPIKHGGWFEKDKDKQEREEKNKEIESAVEPPLILLTEEDKKEMMKALEIPNPYIEKEHVYETQRADFNGEVWKHNYEIDKIEEKKGKKRDNALDDEEPKRKNGISMK